MTPEDKKIEAYKLVNSRLDSEVHEFYSINRLFLVIQTLGIFGIINFLKNDRHEFLAFIPLTVLLITAWHWRTINFKAKIWRDHFVETAKKMENEEVLGENKLWKSTENESISSARGIWKTIMFLPDIFLITWFLLIVLLLK